MTFFPGTGAISALMFTNLNYSYLQKNRRLYTILYKDEKTNEMQILQSYHSWSKCEAIKQCMTIMKDHPDIRDYGLFVMLD